MGGAGRPTSAGSQSINAKVAPGMKVSVAERGQLHLGFRARGLQHRTQEAPWRQNHLPERTVLTPPPERITGIPNVLLSAGRAVRCYQDPGTLDGDAAKIKGLMAGQHRTAGAIRRALLLVPQSTKWQDHPRSAGAGPCARPPTFQYPGCLMGQNSDVVRETKGPSVEPIPLAF